MEQTKKIKLLQGAVIKKLLSTVNLKVYPVVAPESAGSEYIVYRRERFELIDVVGRGKDYHTEADYSINIVSDSYSKSLDIATLIINTIINYEDEETNDIQITNCTETYTGNVFMQEITIKIITK